MRWLSKSARLILILAIVYWAVKTNLDYFNDTRRQWNPDGFGSDAASVWEKRLEILRGDLPKRGVVGYLSEQDYPGAPFGAIDSDEEFVLSQYTLAPLVLDRGRKEHALVVGNFSGDFNYQLEKTFGLKLVYNFGFGIYLFSNPAIPAKGVGR